MVLLNCNCLSVHLCGEVLPYGRPLLIRISCFSSAIVGDVLCGGLEERTSNVKVTF
jgi:hypothetical protein